MEGMGRGESGAEARVLGRLLADMVVLDAIPSEEVRPVMDSSRGCRSRAIPVVWYLAYRKATGMRR